MARSPACSKSVEVRSIERVSAKLLRLLRKQPRRLTGRQLYLPDLQHTAIAMQKSGNRVHDDMNMLVFNKQSTLWRDVPPRLQAKYEVDAQREQERRGTELHGETSLARTNVDLTMARVPASEMSSTACMARRGLGVMSEMSCRLIPHMGPKQSLLDLGGCRKFATTGRRCGAACSRLRVLAGRIS